MCPERVYIFISLCVAPYLYRDPMPHIVLWCWKRNARMCIIIQAAGGTPFCALLRTLALPATLVFFFSFDLLISIVNNKRGVVKGVANVRAHHVKKGEQRTVR